MNRIKLLDCTLREAPLEMHLWGETSIIKIIDGLQNAKVDIIEVGFLKNDPYVSGSTSFSCVEDIEPYLLNKKENCLYVALIDYGRYDLDKLSVYDGKTIDAIRVCFKHSEIEEVLEYAQRIKDKGYEVCIQHVDMMGYADKEIVDFIRKINLFRPFSYSIVDTFGAMYSDDLMHYIDIVSNNLDCNITLGFHAHNNLLLADSNVQIFVEKLSSRRKIIVDSSLYGCGRGAGNAHTELIARYLNVKKNYSYDVDEMLDLIDTVINAVQKKTNWGYSISNFISGIYNTHTFNTDYLLKRHNIKSRDLRAIIESLDGTKKKGYDYKFLDRLYYDYFDRAIDDRKEIESFKCEFHNKKILIIGPGRTVVLQKEIIDTFILKNNPIVIGINNVIEGYGLKYIFCSSSVRYNDLKYCDMKKEGSPVIIVTSNVVQKPKDNERVIDFGSLIQSNSSNADSSLILALRFLIRCGVEEVFIAGMDGYGKNFGEAFYKKELDTNLEEEERKQSTKENLVMLREILEDNRSFSMHFLTESVYSEV